MTGGRSQENVGVDRCPVSVSRHTSTHHPRGPESSQQPRWCFHRHLSWFQEQAPRGQPALPTPPAVVWG